MVIRIYSKVKAYSDLELFFLVMTSERFRHREILENIQVCPQDVIDILLLPFPTFMEYLDTCTSMWKVLYSQHFVK